MKNPKTILYVHGMGGGSDSRIPSILKDILSPEYSIFIRTYDFDPQVATRQLASWVEEAKPDLVIGESLGAIHAVAIKGYPHLFVSPSLNAPIFFRILAAIAWIPQVPQERRSDGQDMEKVFRRGLLDDLRWNAFHGGGICPELACPSDSFIVGLILLTSRRFNPICFETQVFVNHSVTAGVTLLLRKKG